MAPTVLAEFAASAPGTSHPITFAQASTPGKTVVAVVASTAVVNTPSGWTKTQIKPINQADLCVLVLPAASHTASLTSLTLTLTASRSPAVVIFEDYIDSDTFSYGWSPGGNNPIANGTAWGTALHTFTADQGLAFFLATTSATNTLNGDATSFDQGYTEIADSGESVDATAEAARIWLAEGGSMSNNGVAASFSPALANVYAEEFSGSSAGMVAYNVGTPPPLDIPWNHAFWADQPGFAAPADGAALPSFPDNIGSTGGSWAGTLTEPDWVTDMASSGKPAIKTVGTQGLGLTAASVIPMTVAIVGRALGNDSDLFDQAIDRRLIDRASTSWRMYANASGGLPVPGAPAADTNLHLIIATFNGSSSYFYIDGAEYGPFDAGSTTGTASYQIGHSTAGDGNVDGAEIAFVGLINSTLTAQQKADLYTWYQAAYLGSGPPAAPSVIVDSTTATSITLTWNAVPGVDGYRVWVDDVEDTAAGLITGTTYTKTGLTTGQVYNFKVRSEEGAQQSVDSVVDERAALFYTSVDVDYYQGTHTPGVTTPVGEDFAVIAWNSWSADYENARTDPNHFYWYYANTTTPAYVYDTGWLDGATIALRSGGPILIIEWHRGDNAWRQTELTTVGSTHTINLANETTNAGSGGVTSPFNSVFIEVPVASDPPFSVSIWPNIEPLNDIADENALAGSATNITPSVANGEVGYLGYSKQFSVNAGSTIDFAVDGLSATDLDIYRLGHYGGTGKRLVTTVTNTPTDQAAGSTITNSNGATTMAWATTASWAVPAATVSGFFVACVTDTGGTVRAWIPFVVRNDSRDADVVVKVSDSTWGAAYNYFGDVGSEKTGKDVYGIGAVGSIGDRSYAVSYDRPIVSRGGGTAAVINHWDSHEWALIDWLEENGVDAKYIGSYDLDQQYSQAIFTDDFNRANENLFISADWTEGIAGGNRVLSNEVALATLSGFDAVSLADATMPDDQYVKMTVTARGGTDNTWPGLIARYTSFGDLYLLQVRCDSTGTGDTAELFQKVSGGFASIGAQTAISVTIPFTMELRCVGTTISTYIDGVEIHSVTNSSHSSGKVGIYNAAQSGSVATDNTLRVDDFEAGSAGRDVLGASKVFISAGHDEYWSQGMVDNLEAWRDTGKHLLFMSANEVFWRVRWADGGRTMWCYKDTMNNGVALDPVSWTGTFRDTRRPGGEVPESLLTGTFFRMNNEDSIGRVATIPTATYGTSPFWRDTSVESADLTSGTGLVGFEADEVRPRDTGYALLASTDYTLTGSYADDNGQNYNGTGDITWGVVAVYMSATAGLTVGFGTCQWMWGLSDLHDRGGNIEQLALRQATMNLLYDLGVAATTLQTDLTLPVPVALSTYGVTFDDVDPEVTTPAQAGSIWQPSVPSGATAPNSVTGEPAYNLATRFTVAANGFITRLWYYKHSAQDFGTVTLGLMNATTETILASETVAMGTQTGWIGVDLTTPVAVATGGTIYGAIIVVPAGAYYTYAPNLPETTNGDLTALAGGSISVSDVLTGTNYSPFDNNYGMDVSLVGTLGGLETKVGTTNVTAQYVGSTQVLRAYVGSTLVFGSEP